jgi:quercetin dioxygenase-like cupin family protein
MFTKSNQSLFRPLIQGVTMRPLVYEEKTLMCEFRLEKGNQLPLHNHPYEQTGYLISGRLSFRIGDEWHDTSPGDSWCIPENIFHEVIVEEDSHLIEIFAPIRPDYLPRE